MAAVATQRVALDSIGAGGSTFRTERSEIGERLAAESKTKHYGDWRDDFFRDGYYVLKGVISPEKAAEYRQEMFDWLTTFNRGFLWDDKSTWTAEHLPVSFKGGMYLHYKAAHENFMWKARMEPNVKGAFAKIWGTHELITSFDVFNIGLPGRKDVDSKPWPHRDQAAERRGLASVQGILNLNHNGPDDGGLVVMAGSARLSDEFFDYHSTKRLPEVEALHYDFYAYNEAHVKWFEERGCQRVKVCAEPGDLILWDSRTMHEAEQPRSDAIRAAMYICMTPRAMATEEDLATKKAMFEAWQTTTHWPHINLHQHGRAMRDGKVDPEERDSPLNPPKLTPELLKLAGAMPY